MPYSIRILLESAVRNCDNFIIKEQDVNNILNWEKNQNVEGGVEIPFKPARVILQVGIQKSDDFKNQYFYFKQWLNDAYYNNLYFIHNIRNIR